MSTRSPIGGEHEIGLAALAGPEPAREVDLGGYTVASGRTALKVILLALEAAGRLPDRFILPSYLCESMIQPFSEAGVPVCFYGVDESLRIDLAGLGRLAADGSPGVLFVNYFGFPVAAEEREALVRLGRRAFIVEDCAHGSLLGSSSPVVGTVGHVVLTSFRKYLPVPDGGLLVSRDDLVPPPLGYDNSRFAEARLVGKLLRHEFLARGSSPVELEPAYLALFAATEAELDRSVPLAPMSLISHALLGILDLDAAVRRRRANFQVLLEAFARADLAAVAEPVFSALPDGVSPLVFPVRVLAGRRDRLRAALASRLVFCPVHWPLPDVVSESEFPGARRLSSMMLGLPIDQRYDEGDMRDLVERLGDSAGATR